MKVSNRKPRATKHVLNELTTAEKYEEEFDLVQKCWEHSQLYFEYWEDAVLDWAHRAKQQRKKLRGGKS